MTLIQGESRAYWKIAYAIAFLQAVLTILVIYVGQGSVPLEIIFTFAPVFSFITVFVFPKFRPNPIYYFFIFTILFYLATLVVFTIWIGWILSHINFIW